MSRRCVFSTANDGYVPFALTSLISFREKNPTFDAFILARRLGDGSRTMCRRSGIECIELDLDSVFYQEWKYPRECFFHFAAPEVFLARGYGTSVYIDGDTYCHQQLPEDVLGRAALSGYGYQTVGDFFSEMDELEAVRGHFELSPDALGRTRIQSGVLVYDNAALQELAYFRKAADLFDRSVKAGLPRKGDDSLLALLLAHEPGLRTGLLPSFFNAMDYRIVDQLGWGGDGGASLLENCVIYHFVEHKPWFGWDGPFGHAHHQLRDAWLAVMKSGLVPSEWSAALSRFEVADQRTREPPIDAENKV